MAEFCSGCGCEIKEGAVFCGNCGKRVNRMNKEITYSDLIKEIVLINENGIYRLS